MVWVVAVAVVLLSLVVLGLAVYGAYRSGRTLAARVSRAADVVEPASNLQVGPPRAAGAPLTEDELRAREAALLVREAELERRLRSARS